MPTKPAFYWPGSKGRIASWINEMLLPAETYIEPFAGSAAVLLGREPSAIEIINDLDRNVIAFFRALRDQPEELERVISLTPYHEAEWRDCLEADPDIALTDVERARRFFVRTNQGFTSSADYPGFGMSIMPGATTRPKKWAYLTRRLETVAERIKEVQCTNRDAVELLARFADNSDVAVYCDPPYHNKDVKVRYAHHDEDLHERLAEVLHSMRGQVLVSGYPGEYDKLYADWHRIERAVIASGGAGPGGTKGGSGIVRTEVVWSNRAVWPGIATDPY